MRLFIGIPIPPSVVRPYAEALGACCRKGTFASEGNHHLTIAFLGETDEGRLGELGRIVQEVHSRAIPLHFFRYGHFSDIWFLEPKPEKRLTLLHDEVTAELQKTGFPYDQKPFHPHLTLARKVVLEAADTLPPVSFDVLLDQIVLYHSHRVDGNLLYTPIVTRKFAL